MRTKILFTAIAQPHPQHLGDLMFLFFSQRVVKSQSAIALTPTGCIIVGIPVASRHPNAPTHLFDKGISRQGVIVLCHTSANSPPTKSPCTPCNKMASLFYWSASLLECANQLSNSSATHLYKRISEPAPPTTRDGAPTNQIPKSAPGTVLIFANSTPTNGALCT